MREGGRVEIIKERGGNESDGDSNEGEGGGEVE